MKKIAITLISFVALSSSAQNLVNYGMLSNPTNLTFNAGADPINAFHVGYAQMFQDVHFSLTAQDMFGGTDGILGNLYKTGEDVFGLTSESHIDAASLGIKLGKNFLFAGAQVDALANTTLDLDLAQFAYTGMADENGDFDPNYSGDFSDISVGLDVFASVYVGLQREFLDNKLRVGVVYNQKRYLAGARVTANDFYVNSEELNNGLNDVSVGYDFDIESVNIFEDNAIPEVGDLANNIAFSSDPVGTLTGLLQSPAATANTFNIGITAKPINKLELQFAYNGLGATTMDGILGKKHSFGNYDKFSGFDYVSSSGDTLAGEIGDAATAYTDQLLNFADQSLTESSSSLSINLPQTIHGGVNYYIGKRSYLGVHYASRTNSLKDYQYVGANAFWWMGKEMQLKGGYYLGLDEMSPDFVNAAVQFRISPLIQVFVGTRSTSDIATISEEFLNDPDAFLKTPTVPASLNNLQVNFGVSMAFYDKRFKREKEERKVKKAGKSPVTTPPPTLDAKDVKRINDAYDNSEVVEEVKK